MIEDSLRLEETGESYIGLIQYESHDLPHGPEVAWKLNNQGLVDQETTGGN